MRVGYAAQAIIFTVPVQTGIEHGFFAAHGVEISPLMFAGGAKLHQAMLAGAVDIGMASGSDFVTGMNRGRTDMASPYLREVLRFIGLGDPRLVLIGPTVGPPGPIESAKSSAHRRLVEIAATF